MRWLVTGAGGQLGVDVVEWLSSSTEDDVRGMTRAEFDVTDSRVVEDVVSDFRPDVVVNTAAHTAVDAAETDEDAAYLVNATAPAFLAMAVARHGGRLIHVSTDYVFAGDASSPYLPSDPTAPKSAYGRTKLAGERAVRELLPDAGYVVRTAWVFGAHGANFVKTMARLESSHDTVSVVDDQRGSPTWTGDLAASLVQLGRLSDGVPAGTYHCTGGGDATWYEFTQAIFSELGADPARVLPTTTDAFPRPAPRPAYSVLSNDSWIAAGLPEMPAWRDALSRAFAADRTAYLP